MESGCFTVYVAAKGLKSAKKEKFLKIKKWKWIKKLIKVPIKGQSMDLDFREMM